MKKKRILITIAALTAYTLALITGFYFIQRSKDGSGKNTNTASVRQYTHIEFTAVEKSALYNEIGLDTKNLAANGFKAYRESFLAPYSYRKEIHVIELCFENIYCRVTVNIHSDEVSWERERTAAYTPIDIEGRQFKHSGKALIYDDTQNGRLYDFYCSSDYGSEVYREFLRLFFDRENG